METAAGRSLWWDTVPAGERPEAKPLTGDTSADVVIVGGGFTGLWTAYYLQQRVPDRRIMVIDAGHVAFGASGRNGGWCSAEMPHLLVTLARTHGPMAAMRMYRAARRTLDEIERVVREEDISCDWRRDGSLYLARTEPQRARLLAWDDMRRRLGITELEILDAEGARRWVDVEGVLAAGYTPHCAVIQPMRLALGVARAAARRSVALVEHTRVLEIRPGRVVTDRGIVTADAVVCATEGYTGRLPGHRRRVLSVYSRVIATEPLPAAAWERIGWRDRVTVTEGRHQYAYLQRTAGDRLVLGGRGSGYYYGSRVGDRYDRDAVVYRRLRDALAELFPSLAGANVTHHWGGAYGWHRDGVPSVAFDPRTGLGRVGGYGGEGVLLSNLAGRTLAALVAGDSAAETRLPWTNRTVRRWEPEPMRFVGVRGLGALASRADTYEDRTNRTSRLTGVAIRTVL
ncbi:MAG: NAD(P)/FAD-dependent oxidoreductase [Micromonosporaceae bacterium]